MDPRVELLTTVFRLVGADEFNMQGCDSDYSRRVDRYFKPFKSHPAVKLAAELREKRGIGFDGVPTLAVNLSDIHEMRERVPFLPPPARWDKRWPPQEARAFVRELKKFVKDTHYEEFIHSEQPYFAKATSSLDNLINSRSMTSWLSDFYGTAPGRKPFVIVGLLCGGGNYGMSVQFPDGSIEMSPIFGASSFDKDWVPQYDESDLPLIIHEFSHGYVNPLVRKHMGELMPAANRLMAVMGNVLKANAYGEEEALLNETFVRTAETYLSQEHLSAAIASNNLIGQRSAGFLWTSDLVDRLREEVKPSPGKTFEACMPALISEFGRLSQNPQALLDRCPKVQSFDTVWDQTQVTVRVTFDQPMAIGSRGFSMEPPGWEVVKKTEFSPDGQTMALVIKVKKGVEYRASLNRFGRGLISATGYPLQPFSKAIAKASLAERAVESGPSILLCR